MGIVLVIFGLLWNAVQPALAAPGHPVLACQYNYTATVTTDYSIADGTTNDVLTITVTDATTGLPVSGVQVQISIGVNGSGGIATPTTDASGQATLGLANIYATSTPLTVTVPNSCTPTVTKFFHYQAGPPNVNPPPGSPNPSYYTTIIATAAANGTDTAEVEAHVTDGVNNEPPGTPIRFTVTSVNTQSSTALLNKTTTSTITVNTVTGNNSTVDLPITDINTGPVTITCYVNVSGVWTQLGTPQTVTFVVPPPSQANSYITPVITPMPADGSSKDEVQAVVNMVVNGSVVAVPDGTQVKFTIETGTATMTTTGLTTGGVASAYFTSAVPGSPQIQAQVLINGSWVYLNDQTTGNNYSTIVFTIPPPVPSQSYIETVVSPVSANGVSQDVVKAVVNGITGQPVADGTTVQFIISSPSVTMTTSGVTSGGVADAFFTSTTVGYFQVQAEILYNGVWTLLDSVGTSQTYSGIQFVPTAVDAAKSYIQVTQNFATADGVAQDVVTAYLFDSLGHPVAGPDTVFFAVTSPASQYNAQKQILTNINTTGGEFTSTTAGSDQVTVQVQINGKLYTLNDQPTGNAYSTINFVSGQPVPGQPGGGGAGGTNPGGGGIPPGGGGSGSTGPGNNGGPSANSGYTVLFVRQDFQLSDGTHQDSVIAYITDVNKNPVTGATVNFFIQTAPTAGTIASGAQIVGNASPSTDDSGMARIALTSTQPGTVFVDATIVDPATGNTVLIDGSYQIAHFVTKPDTANPQTALIVIIPEALADGLQQTEVKAHVVDLTGAVMPNQLVTFSIDSGSGTIVNPQPVMTDANGDAYIQITSKTPGDVLITATVDGQQIIFGSPARVHFAGINIYVPRVFTPNNDGTNDLLKPILVGISTFHYFTVYNRWGNIVFTTQDPNQGWDGTFKGVPQPVETYLWIAEGIDDNGKKIVARGMTSLVR